MIKCRITHLALKNLTGLYYGFNCVDYTRKIVETYVEFLNCPWVDYQFCDPINNCTPIIANIVCNPVADLILSNLTPTTCTLTFSKPAFGYTYTIEILLNGVTVQQTIQNPTSPLNITGLTPDSIYVAELITHCQYGEDAESQVDFTTPPACVNIEAITCTAIDVEDGD